MVKFKKGDRVRFVDTEAARIDWKHWFERDFPFDTVVTVWDVDGDLIQIEESRLHFNTSAKYLIFASGQMSLPFK